MKSAIAHMGKTIAQFAFMAFALSTLQGATPRSDTYNARNLAPTEILLIAKDSPGWDAEVRSIKAGLDQTIGGPYTMQRLNTDVNSIEAIRASLQSVQDRESLIVLASSGVMAKASIEKFSKANIVFSSHLDPWELGLLSTKNRAQERRTGVTYDINVVPQTLSLLQRAHFKVRSVAIMADLFMIGPWRQRVRDMQAKYPAYRFAVFEVNDDHDLEHWLSNPEAMSADVWFMLGGVPFVKQFQKIKAEAERRHKIGVYDSAYFVEKGGLLCYEASVADLYGIWGRQIALIKQGVPANQIPIEGPENFELSINLDAARRIGLLFPPAVIKTASRVFFAEHSL